MGLNFSNIKIKKKNFFSLTSYRNLFSWIKNGSHFRGVHHTWIWHSNISFPSSVLSAEHKLYLKKKRPQSKGRKTKLVSDNKISEVWTFLFQILAKWDERYIDWPKFTTDRSILFTNGHSDCQLLNSYFERCIYETIWKNWC